MKGERAGAQALGVLPHLSRAHPIPQDRPLLAPVTLRMSGGVSPGWGPMLSWSKWVRPPAELGPGQDTLSFLPIMPPPPRCSGHSDLQKEE